MGGLYEARETFGDLVGALKQEQFVAGVEGPPEVPHRGYLVHGWSGSGKTHLVRSLAGELNALGVPVIEASGGDFSLSQPQDNNGTGADRLANLFAFAREKAAESPRKTAVVVLEDADALFPIRGSSSNGIVARFSQEMERVQPDVSVIVVGTTSRKDLMDATAANRLEKELFLFNPRDASERLDVMSKLVEQNGWKIESPAALKELAEATPGRTIGDLKKMLKEAALKAGDQVIGERELTDARLTHLYGPAKSINTPEWFFRLSVAHELGHAVIRHVFERMAQEEGHEWARPQAIDQIVFQPRGDAAASVSLKYSGNPSKTYEYYFAEICSNYGGRAAEYLFGDGHVSAGPGNDIEFASRLADEAVTQKGMGHETGPVNPAFMKVPEEKVEADVGRLTGLADKASMSIVSFYKEFIASLAGEYVDKAFRDGIDELTLKGRDFTNRLREWEARRGSATAALHQQVRAWRDEARPLLPTPVTVADPAT